MGQQKVCNNLLEHPEGRIKCQAISFKMVQKVHGSDMVALNQIQAA